MHDVLMLAVATAFGVTSWLLLEVSDRLMGVEP
jgi:hypothetical protein